MNNALTKTCAAHAVTACSPLVRLARRGAAVCLLACVAVSAQAQYQDRGLDRQADVQGQRGERFQQPYQGRGDARAFENRAYEDRDEQRRQMQMQQEQNMRNAESGRRAGGRMTPDERRDLRRQINEAGADLYSKTPRR